MSWKTRIGILLLLAAGALVVGLGTAGATVSQVTPGPCFGGQYINYTSIVADAQRIYAGRSDGGIDAISRQGGNQLWHYPITHVVGGFQISDLEMDDPTSPDNILVAMNDEGPAIGPVVAVKASTGHETWRTYLEADPLKLVADDSYLYVGVRGGAVYKLDKSNGQVVVEGGTQRVFRPDPTEVPTGVGGMALVGSTLWVARNFEDKPGYHIDMFPLVHENNEVWRVQVGTMGGERFQFPGLQTDDSGRAMSPSIHDIWTDGTNVYFSAITFQRALSAAAVFNDDAAILHVLASDEPTGTPPRMQPRVFRPIAYNTTIGVTTWPALMLGGGMPRQVMGDGQNVYVTMSQFRYLTNRPMGGLLKLSPYTGTADTSLRFDGWDRPGTVRDGRYMEWGGFMGLHVDGAATGKVVFGTECFDPSTVGQLGPVSALVSEVSKGDEPMTVIVQPRGGEYLPGKGPIVLKSEYPTAPAGAALQTEFYLSQVGGACNDGSVCYNLLQPQPSPAQVAANGYTQLPSYEYGFPEDDVYRLRVIVKDPVQPTRRFSDNGEAAFTLDRTKPEIVDEGVEPVPGAVLTNPRLQMRVDTHDDLSGLDRDRTSVCFDYGRGGACVNGISVRQAGISEFFIYNNNGFRANVSKLAGTFGDGPHRLRVEAYDRAGNVATRDWEIRVDTAVASPKNPLNYAMDQWVVDRRPTLSAQFYEQVHVTRAMFNNGDVTSQVRVIEPDPVRNPLGTRLEFQPTGALIPGISYDYSLEVVDTVGNVGGPYPARIKVDSERPTFSNAAPEPGSLLTEDRPQIKFSVADAGSGVRPGSLSVFLDGKDYSTRLDAGEVGILKFKPEVPLQEGLHTVNAAVVDVAGNFAVIEWSFTVDLSSPAVAIEARLPAEQTAVKIGDKVVIRVTVADSSAVRAVRVNAKTLDPRLSTAVTPTPLAGQPGVYELEVTVTEQRTVPLAEISATSEDVGGLIGFTNSTVLIDNVPPSSLMKPLPTFVSEEFELAWEATPKDLGSGVAYYRLERRENEGEWKVIRPRVNGTGIVLSYPEGSFTRLQFRVSAVDLAGNVQTTPSNVVETIVPGNPFEKTVFEKTMVQGQVYTFTATPLERLSLTSAVVHVSMLSADNKTVKKDLEPFGRFYTGDWNLTGAPPGDYILKFHFRDKDGFDMESPAYGVKVLPATGTSSGKDEGPDTGRFLPATAWMGPLGAAAWAAARRRTRGDTESEGQR